FADNWLNQQFNVQANQVWPGDMTYAVTERFFRSLKTEKLYRENYAAKTAALLDIAEYIEDFYNPKRLHSALGDLSPMMFEAKQPCLTL
ncbi:IS3 family transposase, partial [Aggregatibacter actinomycetemcomitans]|uniref:IS3 family transposase n=1 Tax=Aggregatibacter actinomycetemcomitans TaxID=714 RepID=UPI00197B2661